MIKHTLVQNNFWILDSIRPERLVLTEWLESLKGSGTMSSYALPQRCLMLQLRRDLGQQWIGLPNPLLSFHLDHYIDCAIDEEAMRSK